jgi:hypothetical protein
MARHGLARRPEIVRLARYEIMTTGLAVPNDAIAAPGVTTTLTEILSDELILTGSTGAVGRALGHDFHTTVRLVLRLRRSPRLSENWTHRPTWCVMAEDSRSCHLPLR